MNILIVGVSGFIGGSLYHALSQQGHIVTGGSRQQVPDINWQAFDFKQEAEAWQLLLKNIDVVINATGIYEPSATQSFLQVHTLGPKRLFDACHKYKVRVIQISAIGAEQENPVTDFLKSKRQADQYLLKIDLPHVVLYPGIVLGEQGSSTRQLSLLARLHCIPLVFASNKTLPLISIHQLTHRIANIIKHWPDANQAKVLIATPETMKNLLSNLRRWMGLDKGCFFSIPDPLIKLSFTLFPRLSIGAFNQQSIAMLSTYSSQAYSPISQQTASASLLTNKASHRFKKDIRLSILFYFNLFTLAIIWVISGLSSLVNIEQSRELIALVGINGVLGETIIVTAAIGDILLGILLCYPRLQRRIIIIQITVMLIYSIIITIFIPILWLDPFAPIIKNLAMLVLALYLLIEKKE